MLPTLFVTYSIRYLIYPFLTPCSHISVRIESQVTVTVTIRVNRISGSIESWITPWSQINVILTVTIKMFH